MSLLDLERVVARPSAPIEAQGTNWIELESRLGVGLPGDFKDLLSAYGSGSFGKFIHVFNPASRSPYLNFEAQVRARTEAWLEIRSQFPNDVAFSVFPEPEGVLPWGATDNGDVLGWLTRGASDDWPTVVCESGGTDWEVFSLSATTFLADILSAKVSSRFFPDGFPYHGAEFVRAEQ